MERLLGVDEMDEVLRVFVRAWAELLDLFENQTSALGLIPDLLVLVDDNEQVRLLLAGVRQELLGREGKVILRRHDENYDVDLLLPCKNAGRVGVVSIETWGVDERYVDDPVAKKGCLRVTRVR